MSKFRHTKCHYLVPIIDYCNHGNQSVILLTKNYMLHERTKHINVRMHFIRDVIEQGSNVMKKIPIVDNFIDIMAKLISMIKFMHCLDLIGIDIT